jgi:hypothetical protein
MIRCPSCEQETPEGRYCVRCGAPQDEASGSAGRPSRQRSHYAAAPHEHALVPRLVSTLFPHLPRASMADFRIALAVGGAAVAGLAALRLFPVALITAALLLPLLVALYLIDVDVYEDEPVWALSLTAGWGAIAGVGFGALALAVAPSPADVVRHGREAYALTGGVLLPLGGLAVLLLGPLILLRYQGFNDVLDGVTFGAVAAAAFTGAQAITYGVDILGQGLRPDGAVTPWIWRLLSLGVATPVLTMGAAAAVCAALWLRYRAPVRDANALGHLGRAAVAAPLAGALVVGGAIGETFLPAGAWLGWLVAFDLVVLVILRRAIHVGLLEEAAELHIGPEITCPNCGARTASHTFCGNCGISLQALPKSRSGPEPEPPVAGSPAQAGA